MNRFAGAQHLMNPSPVNSPSQNLTKAPEIHPLSVRLTTLLKPSLFATPTNAFESIPINTHFSQEGQVKLVENGTSEDPTNLPFPMAFCGVHDLLQFTTGAEFFVTEGLNFYFRISNDSETVVTNVSSLITVKDPATKNRTILDTTSTPLADIKPMQISDRIFTFTAVEPGQHVLALAVAYKNAAGEEKAITKHFKFMITKPLAFESSLVSTITNGYLVKAEVTNLTAHQNICIESISFETFSEELVATSLNHSFAKPNVESILEAGNVVQIKPAASSQFLFSVTFKHPESIDCKTLSTLGKCTITWRFPMGVPCSQVSSSITAPQASRRPFTVVFLNLPSTIEVKKVYPITVCLTNASNGNLRLRLGMSKSKHESLTVVGLSGQLSPLLSSGESYTFTIKLFALEAGLLTLNGLRISELENDRIYELNNLITVKAEL